MLLNAPENTLAAFGACAALRIGFEFDVDRSSDGVLVCVHDATVDRTTDGAGRVDSLPLTALKRLDAGGWFASCYTGERIPSIAEVLSVAASAGSQGGVLLCDLKIEGAEQELVKLCSQYNLMHTTVFIGKAISDPSVRSALAAAASSLGTTAQIACLATFPEDLATAIADENSNWVYARFMPTARDVDRCVMAGKRVVLAGTTPALSNQPHTTVWEQAVKSGVHAILTDYPFELPKTPMAAPANAGGEPGGWSVAKCGR